MKRLSSIVGLFVATLVLCLPHASAQDGLGGALSQIGPAVPGAGGFTRSLAAADFDNDAQPDAAVLSQAGWSRGQRLFRIDLHVTAGKNLTISFLSTETDLNISAVDVNRDGAPDIVVERAFTHQRLQVYLNDGHGAFERREPMSVYVPEDSAPLCCSEIIPQNPPLAFLPPNRGFETAVLQAFEIVHLRDAGTGKLAAGVLLSQGAARAPCASRAPPSLLPL